MNDYIQAIMPIIKYCDQERITNPKGYKKTQIWYLYRQTFYGFNEFINWEDKCKASVLAQEEYNKRYPGLDIRHKKWYEQEQFNGKSRLKGTFLLEHVYTGDMFRAAIHKIRINQLSVQNIRQVIDDNYYVAWILKVEDKKLGRKKRGETIQEAFEHYKNKGIILID